MHVAAAGIAQPPISACGGALHFRIRLREGRTATCGFLFFKWIAIFKADSSVDLKTGLVVTSPRIVFSRAQNSMAAKFDRLELTSWTIVSRI